MDGAAFYALAQALSGGKLPAEMRSATSRAYYGAFHRASELLESIGITLPGGPECHRKVSMILSQANDIDVKAANRQLTSLRTARNDADYDLGDARTESQKTVQANLKTAADVIACIDSCFAGGPKAAIHGGLKTYAKNVLRLPVA